MTKGEETQPNRFFVDSTILRLGKWLRLLGLDAPFYHPGQELPERSLLLTKRRMGHGNTNNLAVFVPFEHIEDQLKWFVHRFPEVIQPEKFGTRCALCNEPLVFITKEEARERVPDYIAQTHETFRMCPACKRIYWKGSHMNRMRTFLEHIFSYHRGIP